MLDDRSSKAIKVKLAKAIELIVKEQSKEYIGQSMITFFN